MRIANLLGKNLNEFLIYFDARVYLKAQVHKGSKVFFNLWLKSFQLHSMELFLGNFQHHDEFARKFFIVALLKLLNRFGMKLRELFRSMQLKWFICIAFLLGKITWENLTGGNQIRKFFFPFKKFAKKFWFWCIFFLLNLRYVTTHQSLG